MIASTEHRSSSNSPGVAEDWENEEGETAMQKQLEERFKQVRIMQREKADKDALMERARADEEAHAVSSSEGAAPTVSQQNQAPVKMQILRRPTSGDKLASEEEKARKEQEERGRKKPTLEERQAAYEIARSRIMGVDYKPEPANAPQTPVIPPCSRNKSPEQIRVRKPSPEGMYVPMMPPMQPAVMSPYMMHGMPAQPMQYCQAPIPTATMNPQMQQYQIPITTAPGYMTYFDTSRPPPTMVNPMMNPGPSVQYAHQPQQQIPTYPTGQYFGGPMANMGMRMHPQPQQQVPFGRPPMALYPSGTLGAAMQVNVESGQSQSQRKNRQNKKKSRMSGGGGEE